MIIKKLIKLVKPDLKFVSKSNLINNELISDGNIEYINNVKKKSNHQLK